MSSPELFLVKGEPVPNEDIAVAAQEAVRGDTVLGSRAPVRDYSEDGEDKEEEEEEETEEKNHRRLEDGGGIKKRHVDGEDDGFRTPVSEDRKVSSARECPPAPKKLLKPPAVHRRIKRKILLPPGDNNNIGLGDRVIICLSDEDVEAIFPAINHLSDGHCKIKKARIDDEA